MSYGVVHQFKGGTKDQYEASIAAVHPASAGAWASNHDASGPNLLTVTLLVFLDHRG